MIEILFPGSRNQRYAAACILLELKWSKCMVPNLTYLERKHDISRRILQRARAKLTRFGLIEHVSYLNSRYGGQQGWRLSSRFEMALRQLAEKCVQFRDTKSSSNEKDALLLQFMKAKRPAACATRAEVGPFCMPISKNRHQFRWELPSKAPIDRYCELNSTTPSCADVRTSYTPSGGHIQEKICHHGLESRKSRRSL